MLTTGLANRGWFAHTVVAMQDRLTLVVAAVAVQLCLVLAHLDGGCCCVVFVSPAQIQNVTLTQLPQLLPDESRLGRLLRQLPGSSTPPGVWTILLWPWRRSAIDWMKNVVDAKSYTLKPD